LLAESEEIKLKKEGRSNSLNELFDKLQELGAMDSGTLFED
jgi:hypothetical protein